MRVSVVINNYNYARYVGDAVESALAQTHSDVEVIAVDDGSSDDSASVLLRFERHGVRLVFQENKGQAAAINAGYELATGRLVIFLDADDTLLSSAAAAAVAAVGDRVAHVHWPVVVTDSQRRLTGELEPTTELAHGDLLAQFIEVGPGQWHASPTSGNAWTRAYLDEVMPIPEEAFRMAPDAYLIGLAPLYGSVGVVPDPQTLYRRHGANHSGGAFDEMRQVDAEVARSLFGVASERARGMGLEVNTARWERVNWSLMLVRVLEEIDNLVGRTTPFVLIDGMELALEPSSGRQVIPFLEHGGEYWGLPEDDSHAIRELERLRGEGARFVVLAWPAFWWQDEYQGFIEHVRSMYACRLDNEGLQVFELSSPGGSTE